MITELVLPLIKSGDILLIVSFTCVFFLLGGGISFWIGYEEIKYRSKNHKSLPEWSLGDTQPIRVKIPDNPSDNLTPLLGMSRTSIEETPEPSQVPDKKAKNKERPIPRRFRIDFWVIKTVIVSLVGVGSLVLYCIKPTSYWFESVMMFFFFL